ncbi:MAG: phosphatidylglycerol lysyltransferase domain-containing protein [Marinosulfonomonas sp.]
MENSIAQVRGTGPFAKIALRQIIPITLTALCVWVLQSRIETIDFADVFRILRQFNVFQWSLAVCASAVSFWAIGRYDAIMHRVLGTGITARFASQSGACAIAIAQFVGFGILSGALVRLRMLPGFSFLAALRLSLVVSVTFMVSWGILCVTTLTFLPHSVALPRFVAPLLFSLILCLGAMIILFPRVFSRLPSLLSVGTFTGLVTIDLCCAAIALFIFIPMGATGDISHFLVVYLLAFGAGLISGAPAGMGAFELTMVSLMPTVPAEQLVAAILAYRIVYFVLPACCAAVCLVNPRKNPNEVMGPIQTAPSPAEVEKALWVSDRAEAGLLRQGDLDHEITKNGHVLLSATCGQSHVCLTPPASNKSQSRDMLVWLKDQGRAKMRAPFGYKCSARLAATARRAGWKTVPIVQEAWIKPDQFCTNATGLGQLRRHIKKAQKSGVEICECDATDAIFPELTRLAKHWASQHGGERGFSMGRFEPAYIMHQRVFLAYSNGTLIAFVSFHEAQSEWALDLMRHNGDAPHGTMHFLITFALENAALMGVQRVSLAAASLQNTTPHTVFGKLYGMFNNRSGCDGLYRFKNAFGPKWTTLYAIAPGWISLANGLYDVLMAIRPQKRS